MVSAKIMARIKVKVRTMIRAGLARIRSLRIRARMKDSVG